MRSPIGRIILGGVTSPGCEPPSQAEPVHPERRSSMTYDWICRGYGHHVAGCSIDPRVGREAGHTVEVNWSGSTEPSLRNRRVVGPIQPTEGWRFIESMDGDL